MSLSSNSQVFIDSKHDTLTFQAPAPLKKFKPWVYRPKKVMFSLQGEQPARKSFSTSHWSLQENKKYIQFLTKFKSVIEGPKKNRRKWHLNRIMSKEVGSRSHDQCRSHHQKMLKHYKTVDGILQHLQKVVQEASQPQGDDSTLQQNSDIKLDEEQGGQISNFWNFDNMEQSLGIQLPNLFYYQDSPAFI